MTQNRFYSSVYPPTTLAAAITSTSQTTMSVNSITGQPSSFPYTMLIDWATASQEAVSVTASSGTGPYTLTITRGIDGTTAYTHTNGAIVVHGVSAEDFNEPQVHIATGTSGSGYPNVIHGLASGSSVVGTTDTQTLTNKTLGATSFTGAITASESATAGEVLSITNTHSSPSNANVNYTAAAAADLELGVNVSGDTDNRFQMTAGGKMQWGAGGASAVDTDLYRASAGVLQTDESLTVTGTITAGAEAISGASSTGELFQVTNSTSAPSNPNGIMWSSAATDGALGFRVIADAHSRLDIRANGQLEWGSGSAAGDTDLYRSAAGVVSTDNTMTATTGVQVGSATTAFGGGYGVLGISNAATAPSGTLTNAVALFGAAGQLKMIDAAGLVQNITGSQPGNTVTNANSSAVTAMATLTVPANDAVTGATYFIQGFGVVSTTGTPTITWATLWGGTSGTSLVTTAALTQGSSVTTLPFNFQILVIFTSSTACVTSQTVGWQSAAGTALTYNYQQSVTAATVTTSSSEALVFTGKWSAASASNTMTSWYSAERIA